MPRLSATRYALSLEEAALRFVEAGLPSNIRSLQRYRRRSSRLHYSIKEETVSGLAYFVEVPDLRIDGLRHLSSKSSRV
jgi:hypothetical protein